MIGRGLRNFQLLAARTKRRGNRAAERLRIFGGIQRITGKLLGEFFQIFLRDGVLLLAASGKRKKNFREGLQVVAVFGSLGYLLHAQLLVAMNATKPKEKSRGARKRADD